MPPLQEPDDAPLKPDTSADIRSRLDPDQWIDNDMVRRLPRYGMQVSGRLAATSRGCRPEPGPRHQGTCWIRRTGARTCIPVPDDGHIATADGATRHRWSLVARRPVMRTDRSPQLFQLSSHRPQPRCSYGRRTGAAGTTSLRSSIARWSATRLQTSVPPGRRRCDRTSGVDTPRRTPFARTQAGATRCSCCRPGCPGQRRSRTGDAVPVPRFVHVGLGVRPASTRLAGRLRRQARLLISPRRAWIVVWSPSDRRWGTSNPDRTRVPIVTSTKSRSCGGTAMTMRP